MQFKIITVSALESETEELNTFLSSHKVIEVEKQLMTQNNQSYWTFCIKYLVGEIPARNNLKFPEKIDYRENLSAEEFKRFSHYRTIRKQIAFDESLPAFAIFSDAELAAMAKTESLTKEVMMAIKGIGEKKLQKFGAKFINP